MKKRVLRIVFAICLCLAGGELAFAQSDLEGDWVLDPAKSSAVDPWRRIELSVAISGQKVQIEELVTTGRRSKVSHLKASLDGSKVEWIQDLWTGNRHIGAFIGNGGKVLSSGRWLEAEQALVVENRFRLETSQGGSDVREHVEYRLTGNGDRLVRITLRSSRNLPVVHVFSRKS